MPQLTSCSMIKWTCLTAVFSCSTKHWMTLPMSCRKMPTRRKLILLKTMKRMHKNQEVVAGKAAESAMLIHCNPMQMWRLMRRVRR